MVGKGIQWKLMVCNDIHWFAMHTMHAKCSQAVKQTRRLGCAVELDLCLGCTRKEYKRKGLKEKSRGKGVRE